MAPLQCMIYIALSIISGRQLVARVKRGCLLALARPDRPRPLDKTKTPHRLLCLVPNMKVFPVLQHES